MTDFGLTHNEMTSAPSDENDAAALASTAQPPAASAAPATTQLAAKKAPVRKPKVAATKKAAAKKVSSRKAKPAKPVVTKSSAKKAIAKKTKPLKGRTVKAVVASPQAAQPTARRTELAASSESVREAAKAKTKLVRDSFTMPQQDFGLIAVLKDRALGFKRPAKKSELLRAGLYALQQLTDTQLRGALDSLVPLKAGRPKKKIS